MTREVQREIERERETYDDKWRSPIHSNVEDIADDTNEGLFGKGILNSEKGNQNNPCNGNNLSHKVQPNLPLHT